MAVQWQHREAFQKADDAYQAELVRLFGKDAGDARYQERGKGKPGTLLRELSDEFLTAGRKFRGEE